MDYAMKELVRIRDELKSGKENVDNFHFFEIGGSGQRYTFKHVSLMREIQNLGGEIGRFTGGVNKYRDPAILLAVIHKDYEFIRFLLENGSDPFEKRYNGFTAFNYVGGDRHIMELFKDISPSTFKK